MPEKIVLEDGSEREIPTAEELTQLQEKAKQADEYGGTIKTINDSLALGEGVNLVDHIKELKDAANPNWPKARGVINSLTNALKEKGVEVDGDGNVVSKPAGVTPEQAQDIVAKQVKQELENNTKAQLLLGITDEGERSVVRAYLEKLMPLGGTLQENFELAYAKAFPERKIDPIKNIVNTSGAAPRINNSGTQDDFSKSEQGSDLGKALGLGFVNKK